MFALDDPSLSLVRPPMPRRHSLSAVPLSKLRRRISVGCHSHHLFARVPTAGHTFAPAPHVRQRMRKRGGPPPSSWPTTVSDPNLPVPSNQGFDTAASAFLVAHPTGVFANPSVPSATDDTPRAMTSSMSAPSTVKDRTREFTQIVERSLKTIAQRQGPVGVSNQSSQVGAAGDGDGSDAPLMGSSTVGSSVGFGIDTHAQSSTTGTNSEFAKTSSRIGHGIHGTSQKLERLTQLARRSSMFDDPAREIAELSAVIKSDITALNTAIAELQNHALLTSKAGGSTKQGQDHSVTVVDTLKQRLMGATKSFKDVLTIRSENVKSQNDRRKMFSNDSVVSGAGKNRPNPFQRQRDGSLAGTGGASANFPRLAATDGGVHSSETKYPYGSSFGTPSQSFDGHLTGNNGNGNQHQQQLLMQNQDMYMSSRSEALQNVERTITELGGIFAQLSSMVAEQVRAFPNHHVPPLRSVRLPWLFTHTHHDRLTLSFLQSGRPRHSHRRKRRAIRRQRGQRADAAAEIFELGVIQQVAHNEDIRGSD